MRYDFSETRFDGADERLRVRSDAYGERIASVVQQRDYGAPEAALVSILDEEQLSAAHRIVAALGPIEHLLLIGIGGSSMGTEAVYRALETTSSPALHVLDILDSEHMDAIVALIRPVPLEKLAIVVVSKSGGTTETLANADMFFARMRGLHGERLYARTVCIGDPDTALHDFARERTIQYVSMPHGVGGRFSVFTVAALVPLGLLGVPITALVRGAADALLEYAFPENAPHASFRSDIHRAAHTYVQRAHEGDRVHILFCEHERLFHFVKWLEQLMAESLGKEYTTDGHLHTRGMAPLVMTPRELHSTAQLFLGGFRGVYASFIGVPHPGVDTTITTNGFGSLLPLTVSRSFERIPQAIMHGVRTAFSLRHIPYSRLEFSACSPEEIGRGMCASMVVTMHIAELWNINAFDQPNVELYKRETRAILSGERPFQKHTENGGGVYALFDIGGTKTRVALSHDLRTIESREHFATPRSFEEGVAQIAAAVGRMRGEKPLLGCAGDIRGILRSDKSGLLSDTVLAEWVGRPLRDALADVLGVPIMLENDAALVGLGEAVMGAGQGYRIVAYHTVSTGVGGARIIDGKIDTAHHGFEPGKQSIDADRTIAPHAKTGTLEELISGSALEQRMGKKPYDIPQEDPVWDELASYLAYGIKNSIAYWSPDIIVLGGSMIVGNPRIFLADIERHTRTVVGDLPCPPLVDARLADEGGLYGAMVLLRDR